MGSHDAVFGLLAGEPLPAAGGNAPNLVIGETLTAWPPIPIAFTLESSPWSGLDRSAIGLPEDAFAREDSQVSTVIDTVFAGLAEDALADQ